MRLIRVTDDSHYRRVSSLLGAINSCSTKCKVQYKEMDFDDHIIRILDENIEHREMYSALYVQDTLCQDHTNTSPSDQQVAFFLEIFDCKGIILIRKCVCSLKLQVRMPFLRSHQHHRLSRFVDFGQSLLKPIFGIFWPESTVKPTCSPRIRTRPPGSYCSLLYTLLRDNASTK